MMGRLYESITPGNLAEILDYEIITWRKMPCEVGEEWRPYEVVAIDSE